jgi:hypothetical protein
MSYLYAGTRDAAMLAEAANFRPSPGTFCGGKGRFIWGARPEGRHLPG